MYALIVILVTLVGLAVLEPTEKQMSRASAQEGRLRERLDLLRELGLVRR